MEGVAPRRQTLSDQMALMDSSKLRERLKERDGEGSGSAARSDKPSDFYHGKTLLDIIREEESGNVSFQLSGQPGHKIKWKSFKDRLRIRRSSSDQSISGEALQGLPDLVPLSPRARNIPADLHRASIPSRSMSVTIRPIGDLDEEEEEPSIEAATLSTQLTPMPSAPEAISASEEPEPVRVSLMTLLEQADRHSSPLGADSDGENEEEEVEDNDDDIDGGEFVCCVCMVRHKGAAFIPCGHTFCRLCSRELWVSRGNCPLCNGYILEILDIF